MQKQVGPQDEIVLYSLHPDVKRVLFYLDADKMSRTRFARTPAEMQQRLSASASHTVYGVMREKSFFNDIDYSVRDVLRVDQFNWKWDTTRLWEFRKFLAIRLPLFEKMKSDMLYFQSVPGNSSVEARRP